MRSCCLFLSLFIFFAHVLTVFSVAPCFPFLEFFFWNGDALCYIRASRIKEEID